ncbi:MAG TPA: hypothetical protein VEC06_06585 [Paucimonas sp.]|nr:hypothetical protein [Paucimonas sp.]
MKTVDAEKFHKLYGVKRPRTTYQSKDFNDYSIMIQICGALIWFSYGAYHIVSIIGVALCAFMLVVFPIRHGMQLKIPLILRCPQDFVYGLVHKIQNIKPPYFIALGLLLLENFIISVTPDLPHKVELMHKIAVGLFWAHFIFICAYRTAILAAHLIKRKHVREVLMQSVWKSRLEKQPSITLEIFHAYFTGMLTHIVYLIPWYLVIKYANFSLVLLPFTCLAAYLVQQKNVKTLNDWFYRDHWLGHNSEFDFVYFHGSHHDAIPSGMIAVAGNGYLEGLCRSAIAFPIPFFNPVMAALYYTGDVKIDIDLHQYIPGVFPKLSKEFLGVIQHSLHHFGRLEPYGFAINLDQPISDDIKKRTKVLPDELKYSIRLDQQLTGYEWNNRTFGWYLDLVDKYHDEPAPPSEKESSKLDASTLS